MFFRLNYESKIMGKQLTFIFLFAVTFVVWLWVKEQIAKEEAQKDD